MDIPPVLWENPSCATIDSAIFFARNNNASTIEKARAICHGCPELQRCRAYAINNDSISHGMWGGLTIREIRKIRVYLRRYKNGKRAA